MPTPDPRAGPGLVRGVGGGSVREGCSQLSNKFIRKLTDRRTLSNQPRNQFKKTKTKMSPKLSPSLSFPKPNILSKTYVWLQGVLSSGESQVIQKVLPDPKPLAGRGRARACALIVPGLLPAPLAAEGRSVLWLEARPERIREKESTYCWAKGLGERASREHQRQASRAPTSPGGRRNPFGEEAALPLSVVSVSFQRAPGKRRPPPARLACPGMDWSQERSCQGWAVLREQEGTLQTPRLSSHGAVVVGCFPGAPGSPCRQVERHVQSLVTARPFGLRRAPRTLHSVVDGSFFTRRWAKIEDSIGLSWGVGLELLRAE